MKKVTLDVDYYLEEYNEIIGSVDLSGQRMVVITAPTLDELKEAVIQDAWVRYSEKIEIVKERDVTNRRDI